MANTTDTKIIDFQVNGIQQAVKSADDLKDEFAQIERLAKNLGFKATSNEIKALRKDLKTVTDELNKAVAAANALDKRVDKVGVSAKKLSIGGFARQLNQALTGDSLGGGFIGGLLSGGLTAALDLGVKALKEFVFAESDAARSARELSEATVEAAKSVSEESVVLEANVAVLNDTTLSSEERNAALDKLQETFPAYFDNLDLESVKNGEVEAAYNAVTAAINRKIQATAIQSLAEAKFQQITKTQIDLQRLQNLTTEQANTINGATTAQLGLLGSAMQTFGVSTDFASQAAANLTGELSKQQSEYDDLISKLITINGEQAKNNDNLGKSVTSNKSAEKAEKLRKDAAIEGVKDLEGAITRLNGIAQKGDKEDIENAKTLVRLYEEEALAKLNAAKAVENLSGKSQQELKDEILLSKELLKDSKDLFSGRLDFIEIFGRGMKKLTDDEKVEARKFIDSVLQDAVNAGSDLNEAFGEITSKFVFDPDQIEDAFRVPFSELVKFFENDAAEIRKFQDEIKNNVVELDALKKQSEALGTDAAEVKNKVANAFIDADTSLQTRMQESSKIASEAVVKSIAELSKAYELAGESSFLKVRANLKDQADAIFEQVFTDEQKFIQDATRSANEILGRPVITGGADEGFKLAIGLDDALPEDIAKFEKLVKEANSRLQLGRKAHNLALSNLDNDAADQLIKNAASAARKQIRQDKADQKSLEIQFKAERDRLFALDKEFTDNKRANGEEFNQDEIDQVNKHADQLINLKNQEIQKELDAETEKFIILLEKEGKNSEEQLIILQELYNKRKEIIANGQKDIEAVSSDFTGLLDSGEKGEGGKTPKDIIADLTTFAQQSAQVIDNIFQIAINNQQKFIDAILERIAAVDEAITESQSNIDELESDLEGKRSGRRDAVLAGLALEKEREEELVAEKIRLGKELEEEERKLRKKRKEAALIQAIINGALAITSLNASIIDPTPVQAFRIAANIALGAVVGTQIALIASSKYARGGMVKAPKEGQRDETGEIVSGIVHSGEWVAPRRMVENPKFRPIIDELENERVSGMRGFATGGFTSEPNFENLSNVANPQNSVALANAFQNFADNAMAMANRPIYVKAVEVGNVANKVAKRALVSSIGG